VGLLVITPAIFGPLFASYFYLHFPPSTLAMSEAIRDDESLLDGALVQEQLERILLALITPAIDGVYAVVEATNVRRKRYLEQHSGDVESAVSAAIQYNSHIPKLKATLASLVPGIRIPEGIIAPIWNQIRTAALVASLYGFDIGESEVQCDVLLCLIEADMEKYEERVMSEVCRRVAQDLTKKIVLEDTGQLILKPIRCRAVYNNLMDSKFSVGEYCQKHFRKNSDRDNEYNRQNQPSF
jgi:hypothetical protein